MAMMNWVRLPTGWIEQRGLRSFTWKAGEGANGIAALMVLTALAHQADPETGGLVKATYNTLANATQLSRAKLSEGLKVLEARGLITKEPRGQSTYQLTDYEQVPWGKLPARPLYRRDGAIGAFKHFKLRSATELHALKLLLLIVARRDDKTNLANISYAKIEEYAGILSHQIRGAVSHLTGLGLLHIEQAPSTISEVGVSNAYRLPHVDPRNHRGTTGRMDALFGSLAADDDTDRIPL